MLEQTLEMRHAALVANLAQLLQLRHSHVKRLGDPPQSRVPGPLLNLRQPLDEIAPMWIVAAPARSLRLANNLRHDHDKALTGDDLRDFVNQRLFPYLQRFTAKADGPDTIEYKIGEIFAEIKNRISSGYNMREIIDRIDELRFRSQAEKHELSDLYEAKIKNMGNAGRNGGEYYTPRPLIRAIVQVVNPQLGDRIYTGAVGSAGFLREAYDYLKAQHPKRTTAQDRVLQELARAFEKGTEQLPIECGAGLGDLLGSQLP